MTTLVLASASPRRRELLALTGLPFEARAAGIAEIPRDGEGTVEYVQRVAREKAEAITNTARTPPLAGHTGSGAGDKVLMTDEAMGNELLVIACDTEVVIGGEILGKPKDAADAEAMLLRLRGRTHEVISAVAVLDSRSGQLREDVCRSEVPMRNFSDDEIAVYVASGDPLDKAGAYAIQHDGFHPMEKFGHCYASVMGLPLCHLTRTLRAFGVEPPADVPTACQQFTAYQCPVYEEILNRVEHE